MYAQVHVPLRVAVLNYKLTVESVRMPKQTTRQGRRAEQRQNYLAGKARRSYRRRADLDASLEESGQSEVREDFARVCAKCRPILSLYKDLFIELTQRGSKLKKRKHAYPSPKCSVPYRDIKKQNEWIRENIFDPMGNYLFDCACVVAALNVSRQRLARQRAIKRKQSCEPLRDMTKSEVEKERVSEYVVMPVDKVMSFKDWWLTLDESDVVSVRYLHARHGNAGRTSNSSKTSVMEDFLNFVDINSQPNGRSADSTGPTFYFLPKFSTIQTPKLGSPHYSDRLSRSIVGEFNRAQRERGRGECSNGSCHNWLKRYRKKHGICPHRQDYCDTCAQKNVDIKGKQTALNRLQQAAASSAEDLQQLDEEIKALRQALEIHKCEAQESHEYYTEVTKRCNSKLQRIHELEAKSNLEQDEEEELEVLKRSFNLVLSVDYQMSKLVPYWGLSDQPGSTYYLQKLSHDVYGIVNHGANKSTVYLFNERVGPKNTDHSISYLTHYISQLPDWIKRVHIFMDNTSCTNKNCFTMAWALEMVSQGKLQFVRISFLLAGHTKFAPDLIFAKIAQSYNRSDVFSTEDLAEVITPHADVVIDQGEIVHDWRNSLSMKYSKLPGIRGLHDFVFVTSAVTNELTCKVRRLCHTGDFVNAAMCVQAGYSEDESVIPDATKSYATLNMLKKLSDTKLNHLRQMSTSFIPLHRRLPFL